MYSIYFLYSILTLGMPDKDSMSGSSLCQVSKNCNKVNCTYFCLLVLVGEFLVIKKKRKSSSTVVQHEVEKNLVKL